MFMFSISGDIAHQQRISNKAKDNLYYIKKFSKLSSTSSTVAESVSSRGLARGGVKPIGGRWAKGSQTVADTVVPWRGGASGSQ